MLIDENNREELSYDNKANEIYYNDICSKDAESFDING